MAGGNIGGFFVNLGMKLDKASFNAADQALKGFENTAGKITRALGITTGSTLAMAKAAGALETAEAKAARAIGVGATKLSEWKIAAGVAGTSGAALIGTMTQLENKMQRLKLGQVDQNLAKNLGFLGLNYSDFAKMDSDQRMRAVFNKADGMQDQKKAALLIQETLGSAAREYYDYLKLSGKSLDQQLAEGRALNFTTEKSKTEARLFNQEFNAVVQGAKSIGTFLGSNIAAKLTPVATKIKEILISNRELIQSGIIGFTDRLGTAINGVVGFAGRIAPLVSGLIDKFGGLDQVIIKIGIAGMAMKLAKVAGGVLQVISSVGLLKSALAGLGKGLLAGGLFLVLEDLAYYFMGGGSLIGDIIDGLDGLKEKFDIKLDFSGFKALGDAVEKLIKNMTGASKVSDGLKIIADGVAKFSLNSLNATIDLLGKLAQIGADLLSGKWDKLGSDFKEFFKSFAEGISEVWNLGEASEAFTEWSEKVEEEGGGWLSQKYTGLNHFMRKTILAPAIRAVDAQMVKAGGMSKEEFESYWGKGSAASIQDGIMRPDGTITRVAPDDWVFAARNVEDLAAAFLPQGVSNTMNAPASYIINQNINVNGGSNVAAAVRQQAYNGANDAMLRSMNNSQRILQLMPGQR